MFYKESPEEFGAVLDHVSLPLFVADRRGPGADFEIVFVNRALSAAFGGDSTDFIGKHLHGVIAPAQAAAVQTRWARCADTGLETTCTRTLGYENGHRHWETRLQYVAMPDGRDRIVGASHRNTRTGGPGTQPLAIDDIRYFAAVADIQLRNLTAALESTRMGCPDGQRRNRRLDRVGALCRSVQHAIGDIRAAADKADDRPDRDPAVTQRALESTGGTMLRALSECTETET